MTETLAEIVEAHKSGTATPEQTMQRTLARIAAHADPAIFISLDSEANLLAQARALAGRSDLPLCGVPIAVKDNIDVAGLQTTAACPSFAYVPDKDAASVARLRAAGAIVVGKTNLDQFATGLVGVRSPYGIPSNPHNPALIPGGSSSGSAVAVAAGLVPLALGTDTAGSGRIPAGLNNIVGLKPSLGLVSTVGVVPACRTLDCVSIFALTVDDAFAALNVIAEPSAGALTTLPSLRIGVPSEADRHFFGDRASAESFTASIALAESLGAGIVEVDISAFLEAARLLYSGAWLAERTAAFGDFIAQAPDADPTVRDIVLRGRDLSAVDAFRGFYRLKELKTVAQSVLASVDVLMVPTVPRAYTVTELAAEPVALNSNLGTYTNFVNLMNLSGLAVPATMSEGGTPYGVTFLGRSGEDAKLASLGRVFHAATALPLGALRRAQPETKKLSPAPSEWISLVVVGAHLSDMALNHELLSLGGELVEAVRTTPDYQLFALPGTPARPGLLRIKDRAGSVIEAEVWRLPPAGFGRFVAGVPAPLSIGTVRLADGASVKGFLVEAEATLGARDISALGGWRRYVAEM